MTSPVHGPVPREEQQVEQQHAEHHVHAELPAGGREAREPGAREVLQPRGERHDHRHVVHEDPREGRAPAVQRARLRGALGDLVRTHAGTHARERVEQQERRAESQVDEERAEPGRQRGGQDVPLSQH